MSPRHEWFRVQDMLDAAKRIVRYVEGLTFQDFACDGKTFDAVIRQLIVLGEAASHVPEETIASTPEIPWIEIRGMRNIVVHEYFGVNQEIIWRTAAKDVQELLPMLERLERQHFARD